MAQPRHVLIIGAGMGGLAAAIMLAAAGLPVTVLERAATPGGKIRQIETPAGPVDAGPAVLTLRWVFEEIFAAAGASLTSHVGFIPTPILARHAWDSGAVLDLFTDLQATVDAVGRFAGARDAAAYRHFAARSQAIYTSLEQPFLRAQQPASALALMRRLGAGGMLGLPAFSTLWGEAARSFTDPRLRVLFAHHGAQYGASPFLAPATLLLTAHAERAGAWRVAGGMQALAFAMANLAVSLGVELRMDTHAASIETGAGRACFVRLAGGEILPADAVIMAGDAAALAAGLLGEPARAAVDAPRGRSLSTLSWALAADVSGFALQHRTIFFGPAYAAEFDAVFRHGVLPAEPTIHVCAQDRGATDASPDATERLLLRVIAPPTGDTKPPTDSEIGACQTQMLTRLAQCGLHLRAAVEPVMTGPAEWHDLFPGTGGALYGEALHGGMAPLRRPGARTRLPGLYLAGGSAHPGPGVALAALSGRLAASAVLDDLMAVRRVRKDFFFEKKKQKTFAT